MLLNLLLFMQRIEIIFHFLPGNPFNNKYSFAVSAFSTAVR